MSDVDSPTLAAQDEEKQQNGLEDMFDNDEELSELDEDQFKDVEVDAIPNKHLAFNRTMGAFATLTLVIFSTAYVTYLYGSYNNTHHISHGAKKHGTECAVMLKCAGTGWVNAVIDGSINFFGWVLTGANVVYGYYCINTWLTYFGWVAGTLGGRLKQCAVAGIALVMLNGAEQVLKQYGTNNSWVYDSGAATQILYH
ncbi:hypothetical protein V1520DRAFT_346980 [Lipomyces starkeyi]|uniref:Uncharacterized protein n=1 Tax=Lipomyces starkeyi NRRL Y-11557 TaxID=675824 RepID=A0A1E3QEN7_LIPST|nr:hypothetical protein LIPSTDRAFT_66942 [Lipomyces starkeyi NRRL Y-11557]